ncbi:MAG: indolepyruvate oxidoreductase subunit beta [Candidatus Micrarchaeota archaeon]
MKNFNLILSGIGGQGVLTLAAVIGEAVLLSGYDVKVAELHGLAQRFGPLSTHIRFGKDIHSPLVTEAGADLLLGLERLEVLHTLKYVGKDTAILMGTREAVPTILYRKNIPYPPVGRVVAQAKRFSRHIYTADAAERAKTIGAPEVTANIYLAGMAVSMGLLPLKESKFEDAMRALMPKKFLEMNLEVFRLGIKDGRNMKKR